MKIGDKVNATVTKNGYAVTNYDGRIVGFTKDGRIKVASFRGIKIHAETNVVIIK